MLPCSSKRLTSRARHCLTVPRLLRLSTWSRHSSASRTLPCSMQHSIGTIPYGACGLVSQHIGWRAASPSTECCHAPYWLFAAALRDLCLQRLSYDFCSSLHWMLSLLLSQSSRCRSTWTICSSRLSARLDMSAACSRMLLHCWCAGLRPLSWRCRTRSPKAWHLLLTFAAASSTACATLA